MSTTAPPRPPRLEDPEALIEEAWERTYRRRRRVRIAVALIPLLLMAFGVVIVGFVFGASNAQRVGPTPPTSNVRAGIVRYWYTRSLVTAGDDAVFNSPMTDGSMLETWIGSDGSWRQRIISPGRARIASDTTIGGDGLLPPQVKVDDDVDGVRTDLRNPGDALFTAAQVQHLPTRVVSLRERIARAVGALEQRDLQAWVLPGPGREQRIARKRPVFFGANLVRDELLAIGQLAMSPVPSAIRRRLYDVASGLSGVRSVPGVRDGQGRAGVGLTAMGVRLIFDPRTGALLSGTTGAIIASGPTHSLGTVPRGVAPVRATEHLGPRDLGIAPRAGSRATMFEITLHAPPGSHAARAPSVIDNVFGPTGPNCTYWMSRPSDARIPPGTVSTTPTGTAYTYQLGATAIGRSDWCTGRYELLFTPLPAHASEGALRTAMHFQVATYFQVR